MELLGRFAPLSRRRSHAAGRSGLPGTLLLDSLHGDASLFARSDEVEVAWGIIDPIQAAWDSQGKPDLHFYEIGDWGPPASTEWMSRQGREWFDACRGGEPATCDFAYSGPLTESVLLSNVAYRAGGGFDWDAANLKQTGNDRADEYIFSEFRKGWEIKPA